MEIRCTTTTASAFGRLGIRYLALIVPLSLAAVLTSCGATAPTPPPSTPAPAPIGPVVNIAGTWTGTFASANFPTQTITLMVYQATNCVDGAWSSGSSDWAGSISGYAGEASYSGACLVRAALRRQRKVSRVWQHQRTCDGQHAPLDGASLTPIGACAGDLPQSIVIDLQRQ